MRIVTSVPVMQRLAQRWQRAGVRVTLVPTMGFLHAGHLSLVRRARREAGPQGQVVVSIYVNPTQFGPGEDLSRYPRDLAGDLRLCRGEGADVVLVPSDDEMYAGNASAPFSTYVIEESLSRGLEGASRPTHFRGVTTVVAKLFNIVQPSSAVFGAKDYQQAAIVQRMVRDLNFPVKILVAPIYREPDGLAMSSRNKYLNENERAQAVVLSQALQQVQAAVRRASRPIPASQLKMQVKQLLKGAPSARLDYIEFFHPNTLVPVRSVSHGAHMALAVFVGRTRLIDNGPV